MVKLLLAIPRFLRLPNLLIVVLSLAAPYWCVLRPAIAQTGGIAVLSERMFALLALATVLTTLAGYVINDYFDRQIDAINKPDRVVVGRLVPPEVAMGLYWVLQGSITVVSLALHRELPTSQGWWAVWCFPAVSLLLYLYAWQLKCSPILGNMLVSLLCGVVPLLVLIPENRALWLGSFRQPDVIHDATGLVWIFAMFAFVTNLLREQIKDLEDIQGDAACGCHTLAVIRGVRFAKKNAGLTGVTVCVLLGFLLLYWQQNGADAWRVGAGAGLLLLPAVMSTVAIFWATEKRHFTYASRLVKVTMATGLLLLIPAGREEWTRFFVFVQGYF